MMVMLSNGIKPLLIAAVLITARAVHSAEISVADRMDQVSSAVHQRLKPWFEKARISYPPKRVALVAVKDEHRLKVYARDDQQGDNWHFVMQYKIAKLSGKPGPKLRAGDKQVPEGIYQVTHLNPASKFWLSMALNYPNTFDRQQARKDNRTKLGGDIMLHGWWFSEGCIAVGNTASEDLFVLSRETGLDNISVIITPTDFRHDDETTTVPTKPAWVKDLYSNLEEELNDLGTDGLTTDTRLIAYADIAPPPPPQPDSLFDKILKALADAAETTSTQPAKDSKKSSSDKN